MEPPVDRVAPPVPFMPPAARTPPLLATPSEAEIDPPAPVTPPEAMAPPFPVVPPPDKPPSEACVPSGLEEQAEIKEMSKARRFIFVSFPPRAGAYPGYNEGDRECTSRTGSLGRSVSPRTQTPNYAVSRCVVFSGVTVTSPPHRSSCPTTEIASTSSPDALTKRVANRGSRRRDCDRPVMVAGVRAPWPRDCLAVR